MMPAGAALEIQTDKPDGEADFDDEKNAPFGTNEKGTTQKSAPNDI